MGAVAAGLRDALTDVLVQCMVCGASFPATRPLTSCPDCGGLLDVALALPSRISPETFESELPQRGRHSGVWRYSQLLPRLPDESIVSLWEGNTPLYDDARLAR